MTLFKKQKKIKELTLKAALAKIECLEKENENLSNVIILQKENFKLINKLSSGHKIEFKIGQTVYLKTDKEQSPRVVTGISLKPSNSVIYCLSQNITETWHYGFEISDEKNILLSFSN